MFVPGKSDSGFKLWWQKGIQKIADLYAEKTLMSFETLRERSIILYDLRLSKLSSSSLEEMAVIPVLKVKSL